MNRGDTENELDQKDMNEQIIMDARESSGRDGGRRGGILRFNKCGKTEHNVRACHVDAEDIDSPH